MKTFWKCSRSCFFNGFFCSSQFETNVEPVLNACSTRCRGIFVVATRRHWPNWNSHIHHILTQTHTDTHTHTHNHMNDAMPNKQLNWISVSVICHSLAYYANWCRFCGHCVAVVLASVWRISSTMEWRCSHISKKPSSRTAKTTTTATATTSDQWKKKHCLTEYSREYEIDYGAHQQLHGQTLQWLCAS